MFKERYQHMMIQQTPKAALVQKVLNTAHEKEKQKFRTVRRYTRPAAAILAACMGVTIAMPALAANVEPVYQVMYAISPSVAQFFMPVHLSDENNGIRMEVESAYIHENTAEIYITLQDLTGDRIDGTIDLDDSYDIHIPFDSVAGCEQVGYDEETKTARFYIRVDLFDDGTSGETDMRITAKVDGNVLKEQGEVLAATEDSDPLDGIIMQVDHDGTVTPMEGKNIEGDKITFSVDHFLSHKKKYDNIEIPIDLTTIESNAKTQEVELSGYSSMEDLGRMSNTMQALVPSAPRKEFPVDGVDLTGIAYVDGKLHVQIASEPEENVFDGNGQFWLVKEDGTIVMPLETLGYHIGEKKWVETADGRGHYISSTRYDEYVFDVPQNEIAEYKLSGKFVMTGMYVDGGWRVTFPLESKE